MTVVQTIWIATVVAVFAAGSILRLAQWYYSKPHGDEIKLNYGSYTKLPPHDEMPI